MKKYRYKNHGQVHGQVYFYIYNLSVILIYNYLNHNIYIILYMKLKGGSLKPPEINMFLQASYEEKAPPQINDYMLDEVLSNLYGKVYVNESLKKLC